jgi:hypothetical protein
MMKDFGGVGLRFDFLDDIFGDFLKGRGSSFSFRNFMFAHPSAGAVGTLMSTSDFPAIIYKCYGF